MGFRLMEHDIPAALDTLCELFDLSPFERSIVLLCAGVELDAAFAPLCAAAHGNPQWNYPTFSLALAALRGASWAALSPDGALRRWRLIDIDIGRLLTRSPLRIDERVLNYLIGQPCLDPGLLGLVRPLGLEGSLPPSHQRLAWEIATLWVRSGAGGPLPVVQLCGDEIASKRDIAAAAALIGHTAYLMPATALPADPREFERVLRLWQRETALSDSALLLDCDAADRADLSREDPVARLVEASTGFPLVISSRERRLPGQRLPVTYQVRSRPPRSSGQSGRPRSATAPWP